MRATSHSLKAVVWTCQQAAQSEERQDPSGAYVFPGPERHRQGSPGISHLHDPSPPNSPESKGPLTVTALVLAEPVLASQEVQGGVQVHVNLVNAVPDGLQGGPPVGGLGLLLAPPSGGQD